MYRLKRMGRGRIKILADRYIPYLRGIFDDVAEVHYLEPGEFTAESVRDADALMIRTRCRCNEGLLEGSSVRFIATATIGTDHIDAEYCRRKGIAWASAPGCNANSVANYIYAAIKYALERGLKAETLGVIGVGHVGTKVAAAGRALGLKVLLNDPPREKKEGPGGFVALDRILAEADIVSLHVPLQPDTRHMLNDGFVKACKAKTLIINSARGPVADTKALVAAPNPLVIDCWEGEPNINRELLKKCLLGTPHIAGYSADGKAKGTAMAAQAVSDFFGLGIKISIEPPQAAGPYDIEADSLALKNTPESFEQLRNHYPVRRDQYAF